MFLGMSKDQICSTSDIHAAFHGELSSVPVRRFTFVSSLHKGIPRGIIISILIGKMNAPRATYTQVNSSSLCFFASHSILSCITRRRCPHPGLTANGLKSVLMETFIGPLPETHQTEGSATEGEHEVWMEVHEAGIQCLQQSSHPQCCLDSENQGGLAWGSWQSK